MLNMRRTKGLAVSLVASAALAVGFAAPASAQTQSGLVNVAIGDITITDVSVGVAAQIAANVCGINVGPVVLLAQRVDATGTSRTVCTTGGQTIRLFD